MIIQSCKYTESIKSQIQFPHLSKIVSEINQNKSNFMTVNEKIKLLRHSHNLTQEEMAKAIGMTTNNYAKIERGSEGNIKMYHLQKIAEKFDTDILELLSLGEKKFVYCTFAEHTINNDTNQGVLIGEISDDTKNTVIATSQLQQTVNHQKEIIEQLKEEIQTLKEMVELLKNSNSGAS